MRLWISFLILATLAVSLAATTVGGPPQPATAEDAQVHLSGDADCNGGVDARDAASVVSFVAGIDPADCVIIAGNVMCTSALDMGDALAILRHAIGAGVDVPGICPPPGDPVVAPPSVTLSCDAESALVGDAVRCSYDVSAYFASPIVSWHLASADSVEAAPRGSSVACPPDGVPCIWGRSDGQTIAFDSPGPREISVTGCVQAACTEATWQIEVEPQP